MANLFKFFNKLPPNFRSVSTTTTKNDAWLSKIFVRKIEPTKESHSRMLSDKEIIYSLQTHNYRPDSKVAYLQNVKNKVDYIKAQDSLSKEVELVGSWTVNVGDQDQALHLWKFTGGFDMIDRYNDFTGKNQVAMHKNKISTHTCRSWGNRHCVKISPN
uniref:Protein NipSnap-like n=1 Tax=Diabrotica virgifera virgifera TaxID=50390 RepID=A0A6P7G0D4_DIAVI